MRILHLEDNAYDAELVRRALQRDQLPCQMQVVESRSAYLAAMEAGDFQVILSDTGLPALDGFQAIDIAHARRPEVPLIIVSGHLEPGIRAQLRYAGARDCVSKSNLEYLAPAIRRAMQENSLADPAKTSRYARSMERLVVVVQELSLARDLTSLMAIVRHAARELSGADGATFVLRDGDRCHYADEDAIAPLWKGLRFPMSTCISGWAMLNRQAAVIEDIYADARIPHDAYRPTFVKSLVMVPIRTLDPIGAIGTYWATPHCPQPEEVKLIQALADTTAVAMENIQVYAELEQRVQNRTVSLEVVNRELEAFSYAVSHDLRAPLRHIDGFARMLAEDCGAQLDPAGHSHLGKIRAAAERMGQLIEDLLNLSRTSQIPVARQEVDLASMARDILAALGADRNDRRVDIQVADGLSAHGDPRLLRIVMENLLSNAWKFSAASSPARIEVGTITTTEGQTAYYVRDNGAGFDMANAEKLFGVFQRLHPDTSFPGTGIGLATVQRIINKHGGRIWAEAAVGQGATFYFTLD